jgi:2-oxoglutarate ferredoxin oxidoreductase subunit gamma
MTKRRTITIAGIGGQGIVLCGYVIGKAASLYDNKFATFSSFYGPQARGGECTSTLIIDDKKIDFPFIRHIDILVILSGKVYKKYAKLASKNTLIFVDNDLIPSAQVDNVKVFAVPAARLANDMGNKIVSNIIMLGFFTRITGIVSQHSLITSLQSSLKKDFLDTNLKALAIGSDYAKIT